MDLKIFIIWVVLATTFDFGKTGKTTEKVQIYYITTDAGGTVTNAVLARRDAVVATISKKSISFNASKAIADERGTNRIIFVWSEKSTNNPKIAIAKLVNNDKKYDYEVKLPIKHFQPADVVAFIDPIIICLKANPGMMPKKLIKYR